MKYLSPQQAMLGMRVVLTDNGMIIKSPAGSAEYNLKGRRIKVTGYPEYFPGQLRVKDKRTKKSGRVNICDGELTAYGEDGTVRMRMGRINPPADQKLVDEILKNVADNNAFRDLLGETSNYSQPGTVTINTANFIHNYQGESDSRLMSGPDSDEAAKAAWSVSVHTDDAGVVHMAGMGAAVEDGKKQVAFQAENFELKNSGTLRLKNAVVTAAEFKTRLSDDMREAVKEVVVDVIRNAVKPGGLLYSRG